MIYFEKLSAVVARIIEIQSFHHSVLQQLKKNLITSTIADITRKNSWTNDSIYLKYIKCYKTGVAKLKLL